MIKSFELRPRIGYTNEQLKVLVIQAWDAEVAKKEQELGRKLSAEEKKTIKVNNEFIERWHKAGILPGLTTFKRHFDSVAHLATLLDLPIL